MKSSFRTRIALLSAAISGLVLFGFGGVAWWWLGHERTAALDREIRALAFRHPGWMNTQANYERLGSAIEFIFGAERRGRLILAALQAEGTVRFRSENWPSDLDLAALDLRLADAPGARGSPNTANDNVTRRPPGEEEPVAELSRPAGESEPRSTAGPGLGLGPGRGWGRARNGAMAEALFTKVPRFLSVRGAATTWRLGILGNARDRLVVGLDTAEMAEEMGRMRLAFLLALPVALGVIGAGGWWVAGRAVRPLRRIAEAAERVTARGLDQRLPDSAEDPEIARLVGVLNGMMNRLEASFRQATRFSADASHELKTPLAVMQGELEQALQSAEEGSREQQTYVSLLEETRRLKTITRSLLLLAQADSGQLPLSPTSWNLAEDLGEMIDDARVLAEAADLELHTAMPPELPVVADRVLLRLVISNLLENAIHYNEARGRVELRIRVRDAHLELEVANTGPGIPEEDQARVFERFHRGARARQNRREGLGLGLSLAREILLAHQGTLNLVSSRPGETVFRLTLPMPSPPHPEPGATC